MRFYENPQKTYENREKQRAYYIPEGKAEYTLLNGEWSFAFFPNSDIATEPEKWDKIEVPSCWQILGYENPNYTNINYPFGCDDPYVPTINPMGMYERTFDVKDVSKDTYIVFEGIATCGVLYINGKYVGFTQGSHLQSEFNISKYVTEGENTNKYFFNEAGFAQLGWIDVDGDNIYDYYARDYKIVVSQTATIDGVTYKFDADGKFTVEAN